MKEFFSPYQTLYHANLGLSNQVYNLYMSPRHFAKLYSEKSHRHDSKRDIEIFNDDMGALCGMLYSIITLRAFFPKSPAPTMTDSPIINGNGGDQEEQNKPL